MLKYPKQLLAVAGVIVTAGTVALTGLTAASASPAAHHAARPAARIARPAARTAASGAEHFQLMTTSVTSDKATVIATGAFTAGGVDQGGSRVDKLVFPGGSFKIRHSAGHGTQKFDRRSCLNTIRQHGTYKLGHGTGKFAGISGHGRYRVSIMFVAARNANGTCSQRKPAVAFEQIIRAHGPVHR
jgi:hypothetical protein